MAIIIIITDVIRRNVRGPETCVFLRQPKPKTIFGYEIQHYELEWVHLPDDKSGVIRTN